MFSCVFDINVTLSADLWRLSPLFRSPRQLARLDRYLVDDKMKDYVMKCFATGFISDFEYDPPDPWDTEGEAVLRRGMMKEVVAGRMIGCPA